VSVDAWRGLRQREARAQSEPFRCRVDRDQEVEVAALAEDDEGGEASSRCRAMRSVESRSSHRLRMRCELETLLHTVPLQDPCAEMTTAVSHDARSGRRTDAAPSSSSFRGGMDGAVDDPACRGGGGCIVRRAAQDEAERAAGGGREREPPRRHLIDADAGAFR
jgi:hypothetical protein